MARYRRISPRIWRDEDFVPLKNEEKLVTLYCLTAQSNSIGIFSFSPAMAAEHLETSPRTFEERFGNVRDTFEWGWDSGLKVLWIPTWWRYNKPDNPNSLKGYLRDLEEVPNSHLISLWANNLDDLGNLGETLTLTLRERYPERLRNVCPPESESESESERGESARARESFDPLKVDLPDPLDCGSFRMAWRRWVQHRGEIRKKLTALSVEQQLARLAEWGPARAVAAIDYTIAQGWTGLREPDPPKGGVAPSGGDRLEPLADLIEKRDQEYEQEREREERDASTS